MRHKFIIILLFLFSLILSTCSGQTPPTGTSVDLNRPLTIWWNRGYYPQQDEAIEKIVADWQQLTGNSVELLFFSEDETLSKAIQALENGNPPDILFSERAEYTLTPLWAKKGKLADVSPVIESVKTRYTPVALRSASFPNQVAKKTSYYAVPLMQQSLHIHYWQDLIQKMGLPESIPEDWQGFWSYWKQAQETLLLQGRGKIYSLGIPMSVASSDTYWVFEQILEAYNVQLMNSDGKLLVDQPQVRAGIIEALTWLTNLYKSGYIPPNAINWLNADNNTTFLNKMTLMTLNVSLSIPGSQQQDEDIYLNQMATIEFPNKPDGEPMKFLTSVKQALIFAESQNQTLAQEFLTYLVQPDHLEEYIKGAAGRYFPVMPELFSDPFWNNPNNSHVFVAAKQLREGETRSLYQVFNPAYGQVSAENVWGEAIRKVVVNGVSPQVAVDEAIERIKEIFVQWKTR
ncbi:ABC transporter substrate-binding protein [Capilliphycus salinus ALCB114379]|uniref:ABC transporter substrate-binding protein n=1 Tax=Capilliphycus salinus TaxID=2768948 RepID=UPI0039A53FFF